MGVQACVLGVRTGAAARGAFFPEVSPDRRIAGACLAIGCSAVVPGGWRCTLCDLQSG
jgi:hypothetical protein